MMMEMLVPFMVRFFNMTRFLWIVFSRFTGILCLIAFPFILVDFKIRNPSKSIKYIVEKLWKSWLEACWTIK